MTREEILEVLKDCMEIIMAKRMKKNTVKNGKDRTQRRYEALAMKSEKLGSKIIMLLVDKGITAESLFIQTYALAKALGTLKAVARSQHFYTDLILNELTPLFTKDAKKILNEIIDENNLKL